jgi:predicted esterase
MVWFRNSFELGAERADRDALLSLGGIDEVDLVWINGRFIGTSFGWGTERTYKVPPGLLRTGRNQVALNVLSTWGSGGMLGPQEQLRLTFADGESLSLGSGWQYRRVASEPGLPPRAPWLSIGGIAGLFNAMIAPLETLQIAGVLWYQGESNADHAATYANLLTEMIADWRRRFGASLPFLIVQLPNFGALPLAPSDSGWAAIRDAQRRVAGNDLHTGLVVTADVGDRLDLHPPNKEIVGRRAASVARALVYRGEGIVDGLSPLRAIRSGHDVVVEFDPAVDRLIVVGDGKPVAFELCTDEPASCAYADARLEENRVYITAPDAADATRVRFCWADAPICNLYGASGLPVGSFEYPLPARESLHIAADQGRSAGRIAIDTIDAPSLRNNLVGDSPSRKVLVYLPPGYEDAPDTRYPVIYLLHSYGADPESWLGRNGYEGMHVGEVLDALIASGEIRPLIVVMPDAKNRFGGSWYTDSATTGNWESFIADDLVSMVDGKYRTLARREGRGIAGQSMGAYGALRLAMHRPGTFAAVLAMSPVNLANPDPFGAPAHEAALAAADAPIEDAPLLARLMWSKAAAFSPDPDVPPHYARLPFARSDSGIVRDDRVWADWLDDSLVQRVPRHVGDLRRVHIRLEAGDRDPAIAEARAFAGALRDHDVPFTLETFEGGHVEGVRRRFETAAFAFFDQFFREAVNEAAEEGPYQ